MFTNKKIDFETSNFLLEFKQETKIQIEDICKDEMLLKEIKVILTKKFKESDILKSDLF